MKLLVITQKVDINDDNLGFFHGWLEKFAEKVDKLYVICLWQGEYDLPENVEVYSMGKESGASKLGQFFRLQRYLINHLGEIDGVLVHMCPIYTITSFTLVKLFKKRMVMWYTHKSQNWKVWLSEKLVQAVVTASKESFRIKSGKLKVLGHGIDIDFFHPEEKRDYSGYSSALEPRVFNILTAGRIVPSKGLEIQIRALDILVNKLNSNKVRLVILGSAYDATHPGYLENIKTLITKKGLERFVMLGGSVPNSNMPDYYNKIDVFINSSSTGSIDKVVLEAMACGVPTISSNEAFASMLSFIDKNLYFREGDAEELSQKVKYIMNLSDEDRIRLASGLREIVVKKHNLENLTTKIISEFKR